MARIRSIKPEFPQSESIGRLSRDARLLFIELWTIVDDAGRARAASRMLASLLFPFDDDAPKLIDGWLAELEGEEMIVRYSADGNTYLQIQNWLKHQKIDHPSPSRIPEPTTNIANSRESSRTVAPDLGPRTRDRDKDSDAIASSAVAPIDPKSEIFGEGLGWLKLRTSRSESSLRSWLGKCCGEFGDHATLAALIEVRAQAPPAVDALSRMRVILEPKKRKPPDGPATNHAKAIAELLAERSPDHGTGDAADAALLDSERGPSVIEGEVRRLAG